MKAYITFILILTTFACFGQRKPKQQKAQDEVRIDSMFVNLYTDSLKKGTYNYINVDGKLSNGRYIPLDSADVIFIAADGKFHGNNLWVDPKFGKEKISIKVILKSDPKQFETFDMYIKRAPDPELKTEDEIIRRGRKRTRHS